jgi:copper chaperone CopZ
MDEVEIRIHNMSCDHCVMLIRESLGRILGVEAEEVVPGSARVRYDESVATLGRIHAAIEEAGYSVVS